MRAGGFFDSKGVLQECFPVDCLGYVDFARDNMSLDCQIVRLSRLVLSC